MLNAHELFNEDFIAIEYFSCLHLMEIDLNTNLPK